MPDMRDRVLDYVSQLTGHNCDDAWHALVELGSDAADDVVAAFAVARSKEVRRLLVNVMSQYRTPKSVPFFSELLGDADEEIRNLALDGLVTLGSVEAVAVLERSRLTRGLVSADCIEEALEQIRGQAQ